MKRAIITGLLFTLVSVGALAGKVSIEVNFDPEVDFSQFKTYAWKEGAPANKPEVEQWVRKAVNEKLRANGWKRIDTGADVEIASYVVGLYRSEAWGTYFNDSYGYGGWMQVDPRTLAQGAWMVEMTDVSSQEKCWRGIAKGATSDGANWHKAQKKIPRIADKLFADFPPGVGE